MKRCPNGGAKRVVDKAPRGGPSAREAAIEIRIKLGMTQEEFGKLLGLSRDRIASRECGRGRWKMAELRRIIEVAGINRNAAEGSRWEALRRDILSITGSSYGAQSSLANYLGLTRQSVSQYLRGTVTPSPDGTLAMIEWLQMVRLVGVKGEKFLTLCGMRAAEPERKP